MKRWHRLAGLYVGAIIATVSGYAVAYNVGMATLENDPQSFVHSLEVVLIHFATVGYDTEVPRSGAMTALVALISFTGQILVPIGVLVAVAFGLRERSSAGVHH